MAKRLGLMTACVAAVALTAGAASAADIHVHNDDQFRAALRRARAGDHIRLNPGRYGGGFYAVGLEGDSEHPIVISSFVPERPAVFASDSAAILQMVRCSYIELRNLHIARADGNGLNFDDGDKHDFSCHHITVRGVRIDEVGGEGTANGIKLAGVSDFSITDCVFQKWGENGGCAIDGVGCRFGTIARCQFLPGRGSVGVQFKGGSEAITIRHCLFNDAAARGVNVGGTTGMSFFRPKPQGFEARQITVEGNVFIGGEAAVAFPNTDGALVRGNTIYLPGKWAFRILQETNAEGFTPSRNARIEDNIIVFKSAQWFEGGINIGPNTAPETFNFSGNLWYCQDDPAHSAPRLPSAERAALIGQDPRFTDPAHHDFALQPGSPAQGKGSSSVPDPDAVGP
jgi:hypothetical protein